MSEVKITSLPFRLSFGLSSRRKVTGSFTTGHPVGMLLIRVDPTGNRRNGCAVDFVNS